jgi:hypothetical protein
MGEPEKPRELKFHYIKSNFFRTVHADGVLGGLSPTASIIMNFYSERQAIPKIVTHEIKPDMTLGQELKKEGKEGIVREVEISISMGVPAAQALKDWLETRIKEFEEAKKKYDFLRTAGTGESKAN